jgi:hypothetical protein
LKRGRDPHARWLPALLSLVCCLRHCSSTFPSECANRRRPDRGRWRLVCRMGNLDSDANSGPRRCTDFDVAGSLPNSDLQDQLGPPVSDRRSGLRYRSFGSPSLVDRICPRARICASDHLLALRIRSRVGRWKWCCSPGPTTAGKVVQLIPISFLIRSRTRPYCSQTNDLREARSYPSKSRLLDQSLAHCKPH